jgi:hypothetical protein
MALRGHCWENLKFNMAENWNCLKAFSENVLCRILKTPV